MNNTKLKYDQAFIEGLALGDKPLNYELTYNSIPEWDSIGHMSLIGALEENFGISMDTADIVEFGSYAQGIQIMKKYKVEIPT
jgi:acyl carrier protein